MFSQLVKRAFSLCFAVVLVLCVRYVAHLLSVRRTLKHIPGPRASSYIWGEEWLLYHSPPGCHYVDWHRQYGKVVKFTGAFGHQMLSITDPRAVGYILGAGIYSFPKPHGVREWFRATTGEGILWVEGKEAHERQKRSLAPTLNAQAVRNMTHIFYETSAKLASQWTEMLNQWPEEEMEIEITNWASRYALDTVGRAAFSHDFKCLDGKPHSLAEALDGLTNNENKLSSFYMRALFWFFPSILSIGEKGKMIRKAKLELGSIATRMWNAAKLMACEHTNILSGILQTGEGTGEEQIISQMRTLISAAHEPVSAIIAWALYELAINENLQRGLREEIMTSGAREPSYDAIAKGFPLLDAVIHETLRVHPPILENHHQAAQTTIVPLSEPLPGTSDCQLVIPKGTILEIPVNIMQTDPAIWGSDADVFRPERWLERKREGIRHPREILAFSEGPRACVGKAFALFEIKALLVTLLQHFSFGCKRDIEAFQSFVIRPRIKGEGASSLPLIVRKL